MKVALRKYQEALTYSLVRGCERKIAEKGGCQISTLLI
jgi:hypothetical protein